MNEKSVPSCFSHNLDEINGVIQVEVEIIDTLFPSG